VRLVQGCSFDAASDLLSRSSSGSSAGVPLVILPSWLIPQLKGLAITAATDCELFVIERRDFLPLMREKPDIALRLIEILCSKLRRTTEQAEEVMFLDLPRRLAKALMRLVDADSAGRRERKISITQRELGNIIGMSRESINKQLRIWEDKKWVRLERNAVVILATDQLAAIAEDDAHGA
jgi:CRP/FNR family transcriptional regulator, cyclic AMP receptor protein